MEPTRSLGGRLNSESVLGFRAAGTAYRPALNIKVPNSLPPPLPPEMRTEPPPKDVHKESGPKSGRLDRWSLRVDEEIPQKALRGSPQSADGCEGIGTSGP